MALAAEVIARRPADVVVADADLGMGAQLAIQGASDLGILPGVVGTAINGLKSLFGGFWVSGMVTLTKTELKFEPNVISRVVFKGKTTLAVPVTSISDVTIQREYLLKIIAVKTPELVMRVRCLGSASLARKIRQAAGLPGH